MKTFARQLAVLALLCASSFAESGGRPKAFGNVPFGAAPEEVLRLLAAKPGITLPEEPPTADRWEVLGGTFAGQTVQKWSFEFVSRKLASAAVVIKPESGAQTLYRDFKTQLSDKYGPQTGEKKLNATDDPDRRSRTRESGTPSPLGNIAYWKFPPTLGDKSQRTVTLELSGPNGAPTLDETNLQLTLRYTDETLKGTSAKTTSTGAAKVAVPVKKEDL